MILHERRARLESRGHCVQEGQPPTVTGFDLWPGPDTIVTLALEPDETL